MRLLCHSDADCHHWLLMYFISYQLSDVNSPSKYKKTAFIRARLLLRDALPTHWQTHWHLSKNFVQVVPTSPKTFRSSAFSPYNKPNNKFNFPFCFIFMGTRTNILIARKYFLRFSLQKRTRGVRMLKRNS